MGGDEYARFRVCRICQARILARMRFANSRGGGRELDTFANQLSGAPT